MGDSAELRNAAIVIPPYHAWPAYLYTSGAAASQDLSLCGQLTPVGDNAAPYADVYAPLEGVGAASFAGFLGRYCNFAFYSATAGAFCIVKFADVSASVLTANVPVIPSTTSNVVNGVGSGRIVWGGSEGPDFFIGKSTRWLGFIGSAAGWLVVTPSSRGANG